MARVEIHVEDPDKPYPFWVCYDGFWFKMHSPKRKHYVAPHVKRMYGRKIRVQGYWTTGKYAE